MATKKNPFAKTRKQNNCYMIWENNSDWTWYVLKTWQRPDKEDFYSRWFCAVSSPYTYGETELGDVYGHEIRRGAHLAYVNPAFEFEVKTSYPVEWELYQQNYL